MLCKKGFVYIIVTRPLTKGLNKQSITNIKLFLAPVSNLESILILCGCVIANSDGGECIILYV